MGLIEVNFDNYISLFVIDVKDYFFVFVKCDFSLKILVFDECYILVSLMVKVNGVFVIGKGSLDFLLLNK